MLKVSWWGLVIFELGAENASLAGCGLNLVFEWARACPQHGGGWMLSCLVLRLPACPRLPQVNSKLDELAPAQPAPAAAAEPAAEGGEQMETDQAATATGGGGAAEEASPFAKRLALFKVSWGRAGA